jgi:hypothetical protein
LEQQVETLTDEKNMLQGKVLGKEKELKKELLGLEEMLATQQMIQ